MLGKNKLSHRLVIPGEGRWVAHYANIPRFSGVKAELFSVSYSGHDREFFRKVCAYGGFWIRKSLPNMEERTVMPGEDGESIYINTCDALDNDIMDLISKDQARVVSVDTWIDYSGRLHEIETTVLDKLGSLRPRWRRLALTPKCIPKLSSKVRLRMYHWMNKDEARVSLSGALGFLGSCFDQTGLPLLDEGVIQIEGNGSQSCIQKAVELASNRKYISLVTHCGLGSLIDAILTSNLLVKANKEVTLIIAPGRCDQFFNAKVVWNEHQHP